MILRTMAPLGCQKISPGAGNFLDGEKVELLTQHAMIAFGGSSSRAKCWSISLLEKNAVP